MKNSFRIFNFIILTCSSTLLFSQSSAGSEIPGAIQSFKEYLEKEEPESKDLLSASTELKKQIDVFLDKVPTSTSKFNYNNRKLNYVSPEYTIAKRSLPQIIELRDKLYKTMTALSSKREKLELNAYKAGPYEELVFSFLKFGLGVVELKQSGFDEFKKFIQQRDLLHNYYSEFAMRPIYYFVNAGNVEAVQLWYYLSDEPFLLDLFDENIQLKNDYIPNPANQYDPIWFRITSNIPETTRKELESVMTQVDKKEFEKRYGKK